MSRTQKVSICNTVYRLLVVVTGRWPLLLFVDTVYALKRTYNVNGLFKITFEHYDDAATAVTAEVSFKAFLRLTDARSVERNMRGKCLRYVR